MEHVIQPVDKKLIIKELSLDKYICKTNHGGNYLYSCTAEDSPNIMREIGRLRELTFRFAGGGTGKSMDIDEFDIDKEHPYQQLIVFDPQEETILGGYRYIDCAGLPVEKMATSELFNFSDKFKSDYLPYTIELGRSFVHPNYQRMNISKKSIFALDNLWNGLGALTVKYGEHRYFFGKVTMYTTYNVDARNMLLNFMHIYFDDKEGLVTPMEPIDYNQDSPEYQELFKGLSYKEGYKVMSKHVRDFGENVPPLINSYMNISPSMRVFGTAINKGFGEVEETGILVTIPDMYPEKASRHIEPLKKVISGLRTSRIWWKQPSTPYSLG